MRLTLCLLFLPMALCSQFKPQFPENCRAYLAAHPDPESPSRASGGPAAGSLSNGCLMPYLGRNFFYFDTTSYLHGRAFVHSRVKAATIAAYDSIVLAYPGRWMGLMECGNQKGGRLWPHRTHQNGMSIDFMVPLLHGGVPYYALDTMGLEHYLLEFDDSGHPMVEPQAVVDFDLIGRHLIFLQESARQNGLKIAKVILKLEWKDHLFATRYGKLLQQQGIYFASELTSLINGLHDNHYHVDFAMQ